MPPNPHCTQPLVGLAKNIGGQMQEEKDVEPGEDELSEPQLLHTVIAP